jgi:hypothetical protein
MMVCILCVLGSHIGILGILGSPGWGVAGRNFGPLGAPDRITRSWLRFRDFLSVRACVCVRVCVCVW